jgi:hypothetical protein
MFIIEDYKELKQNAKPKPLVMSVKNTKKGSTLIIAVVDNREDKRK